jgi:NADH-quinone oxidoreductase subunit F
LDAAIRECYEARLLGKNILGSGLDLDIHLHRGAGAYICGEETGLIESLEGKRAWPRIKPPYPAIEGLFHKPTIVNNVETLCCVTHILQRGAEWFKSIGVPPNPNNPRDQGSYGPKLYCISAPIAQASDSRPSAPTSTSDVVAERGGSLSVTC